MKLRLLIAALGLSLCGCFDLLQEIWINPDGSARLVLDISLPKSLMQLAGQDPITKMREEAKATEAELKKDPAVKKFAFRDYEEGDVRHLVYELEVTDATRLSELQKRALESADAASRDARAEDMRFEITRGSGGNYLFTQRFSKGGGADAGDDAARAAEELGRKMAMAMLAGHYVTVKVHGPAIVEANGVVNAEKDTVEWKVPLADLMGGGKDLRAEISTGGPLWVWAVVLGVPAMLLALAVAAMRRRRAASV